MDNEPSATPGLTNHQAQQLAARPYTLDDMFEVVIWLQDRAQEYPVHPALEELTYGV